MAVALIRDGWRRLRRWPSPVTGCSVGEEELPVVFHLLNVMNQMHRSSAGVQQLVAMIKTSVPLIKAVNSVMGAEEHYVTKGGVQ